MYAIPASARVGLINKALFINITDVKNINLSKLSKLMSQLELMNWYCLIFNKIALNRDHNKVFKGIK